MGLSPGVGGSHGVGKGNPSCITAWKILWTEKPNWLQSTGSNKVYMYIYVSVYIYIYIHIYIHTYICVYIYVRSVYFSSLVVIQQKFERFKTVDKLQLSSAQADRSFIRQTLSTQRPYSFWLSPLYTSCLLFLVVPCANIGLVPTTNQWINEREYKWAFVQGQLTNATYITADSAVYVFP